MPEGSIAKEFGYYESCRSRCAAVRWGMKLSEPIRFSHTLTRDGFGAATVLTAGAFVGTAVTDERAGDAARQHERGHVELAKDNIRT